MKTPCTCGDTDSTRCDRHNQKLPPDKCLKHPESEAVRESEQCAQCFDTVWVNAKKRQKKEAQK